MVATPGALAHMGAPDDIVQILAAHGAGEWGELDDEDKQANDAALVNGDRILSCYRAPDGEKVWVITEWDRSVTTILLPEDY